MRSNIITDWWGTIVFIWLLRIFAGWKRRADARKRRGLSRFDLRLRNIQTGTDCAVRRDKGAAAETQPGSTLGTGRISTGTLFLSNFGKPHG